MPLAAMVASGPGHKKRAADCLKRACDDQKYEDGSAARLCAQMKKREIEKRFDPETIKGCCLLCSEVQPHHCHRRLVAEYLKSAWGELEIRHLT